MNEVGTLRELDVKPGDVVKLVCGGKYTIGENPYKEHGEVKTVKGFLYDWREAKVISRASDKPKLWRDMTDAEKGALLLAHHEGKVIECMVHGGMTWHKSDCSWYGNHAYRIRPEPKVETVAIEPWEIATDVASGHRITFQTINGKPDTTSIKMEAL